MKVYFMRHAQMTYNVNGLINCDPKKKIGLTEIGKKEAIEIAGQFKIIPFDIIFVSQFLRTKQTAEIINKYHNVKIKVDKRLNEFNIGFEGQSIEVYRKTAQNSGVNKYAYKIDDKHESFLDAKNRISNFLSDLKKEKHETVLVITHEVGVKMAYSLIKKVSEEEAGKLKVYNGFWFDFEL